jgi:hypothetical protein
VDGVTGVAVTESVTVAVADWGAEPESDTAMPKEKVPLIVGVPEMTPVLAARLSPAGSWPDARLQL